MDSWTPLGESDPAEIKGFWQRFLAATGRHPETPQLEAWPFGAWGEALEAGCRIE
ncbi:MAG: hypothetical protein GY926_01535 [bacterium]|nr:hypothetical protein [bacterium]